eukprot:m.391753 g.391753  ORF g.391753 m.391753 type:complete len:147 (+) comp56346_c0_seq52:271-711(+)
MTRVYPEEKFLHNEFTVFLQGHGFTAWAFDESLGYIEYLQRQKDPRNSKQLVAESALMVFGGMMQGNYITIIKNFFASKKIEELDLLASNCGMSLRDLFGQMTLPSYKFRNFLVSYGSHSSIAQFPCLICLSSFDYFPSFFCSSYH